MTNEELKAVVLAAVEKRKSEGFRFVRSTYFSVGVGICGCLVGATLNRRPNYAKYHFPESDLAEELGATEDQILSMEAGFCAWGRDEVITCGSYHEQIPEMYDFGKEMATKVGLNYEYAH